MFNMSRTIRHFRKLHTHNFIVNLQPYVGTIYIQSTEYRQDTDFTINIFRIRKRKIIEKNQFILRDASKHM